MSRAAKSLFWFSFWILACGVLLLFFPHFILDLVNIHMDPYILARLFGMVLVFNSFYYFMASKHEEMRPFYRWTTYTRFLALPITVLLVIIDLAKPVVLLFVLVDTLGAIWTTIALRGGEHPAAQPLHSRLDS